MPRDPRLPLKIKSLDQADGRRALIVYGRDEHVARAANALTIEEARELAKEVARLLTDAWSDR